MQTAASDSVTNTLNSLSSSRIPVQSTFHRRQHNEQLRTRHQTSGSNSSKDTGRKGDSVPMPPPNRLNPILQGGS